MKLLKKAFAFTFIFMLSVSGLTGYQVNASEEQKHLDILFTHDLHSHLNSFQTIVDGTQQETGGFEREYRYTHIGWRRLFHGNSDTDCI